MGEFPKPNKLADFYGIPGSRELEALLVIVTPPWKLYYAGQRTRGVRVHRLCSARLGKAFEDLWELSEEDQAKVHLWGLDVTAGGYNPRRVRGGTGWSLHAYGAAVDFDPNRNPFKSARGNLKKYPEVIEIFEKHGWYWGGRFKDPMHFEAVDRG